jgi:L-ascorbate metabolism protein UlaG (beta-lactamase superfamily)
VQNLKRSTRLFHGTFALAKKMGAARFLALVQSMILTYLGHSTFQISANGVNIVLDPFISPNPLAAGIDLKSIKADYILISHGHQDHVADVEQLASIHNSTVVACYELAMYYGAKGIAYHPMNIGGAKDFGSFKVKCVNAVHSSVLADGTYGGSAMGFVISFGNKHIYYSGDTALHMDMQLIKSQFSLSAAILCVGDNFTMGADDAIIAAGFVGCKNIIGMHFDTFPYIKVNHESVISKFENAGLSMTLPVPGQQIEI